MLAVAVRSEWIVRNPADGIEMPQGEVQREVRVLTDDEVERLADEVPPRYRALVLMLTETGARPGEAFALRVKNLKRLGSHRGHTTVGQIEQRYGHLYEGELQKKIDRLGAEA